MTSYIFCIAQHYIKLDFDDQYIIRKQLLLPFMPFMVKEIEDHSPLLFTMTVTQDNIQAGNEAVSRMSTVDTGNGDIIVDRLPNGGYQYTIKNIESQKCCLLKTDKLFQNCTCQLFGDYNMQRFGLNNALMLSYTFAGSYKNTLLIHASLIRHEHKAYAFTAKSGTGKSTQANLWLQHVPNCDLMNDDNPIIRLIDQKLYAFGSPWSGKTPCYRNIRAELGAIIQICRAQENFITQLSPIQSFIMLMGACSSMKWDVDIYERNCQLAKQIIEASPIYALHCLPNKESAILCQQTVAK